jgi:hydroxyethylthiazole kinase-like uncharacterized protein yjeF
MVRRCDGLEGLAAILADERKNALALGPGNGVSEATRAMVRVALGSRRAIALDADALTSFGGEPDQLASAVREAGEGARIVITPHEGEFSRLFQSVPEIVEAPSKLWRARAAAAVLGVTVILKGPDTVIAGPDGRAAINDNATPWLATAGSGDVLTGLVTGLLAQHVPAFEAACAAVWMHGAAGAGFGPGLIAEDLPEALPGVLKSLFDASGAKP